MLTEGEPKPAPDDNKDQSLLNQEDKSGKKDEPKGPPEKYEFKLPEGYELSEETSKSVTEKFKAAGLSQEQAQGMIDLHTQLTQTAAEAPYDLWANTQEEWVKEIKADPEIGGKLDQVRSVTAKAIDSLGPQLAKDFREALNFTGAGNNPAFVRAFYKIASQLSEGGHVKGGGVSPHGQTATGTARAPSAAQAMYPTLPSQSKG